jgi:formate--tetrahydrofolate ligase
MAIFCLATSRKDLKKRLANIIVGYTREQTPIRASDLQAQGAMAALLKDAIKPNLVQTLENNPAIIHGGPFANIAHGCNTVTATQAALKLGEYVVTEAGFGADLGAEKFIDIKCRKSGLRPDCAVVVATLRALKHHGGVDAKDLNTPNLSAVEKGLPNLERHVNNIRNHYGLPCVVSINHFTSDTQEELDLLRRHMDRLGVPVVLARHWADGSAGAEELAHMVVKLAESGTAHMRFVYEDGDSLWDKMKAIATKVYGAADISADTAVRAKIAKLQQDGYGHYPVCVAKTQYSFSTDPKLRAAPSGHMVNVREVRLAAGAEFVVMICGDIMTMPGLPKEPASARIDIDDDGKISGLF